MRQSFDRDFKLGLGACAKAPGLKANDGLAAEAAVAKLFEQLARAVQFNHGAGRPATAAHGPAARL